MKVSKKLYRVLASSRPSYSIPLIAFALLGTLMIDVSSMTKMLSILAVLFWSMSVYSMNYISDVKENEKNNARTIRHGSPAEIKLLGVVTGIAALWISWMLNPLVFILMSFLLATGIMYSFRVFGIQRLKEVPVLKSVIGAVNWGLVLFIPLFASGFSLLFSVAIPASLLFAVLTLQVLISKIMGDLRDIKGDLKAGIITIPVIMKDQTIPFFTSLNLASVALLSLALYFGLPTFFVAMTIPIGFRFVFIELARSGNVSKGFLYETLSPIILTSLFIFPFAYSFI